MRIIFLGVTTIFLMMACNQAPRDVKVVDPTKTHESQQSSSADQDYRPLKVAVSSILSPKETFESYEDIFQYISTQLDIPIEFHQQRTYEETNAMLEEGQLDLAFICSGAYADLNPDTGVELFAFPVCNGEKFYKGYIITHESYQAESLEDLAGTSFAFTDPLSNTGYLYVKHRLMEMGREHESFFGSTLFSNGHDVSIQMVSKGIVDAASVSNLVFEYLKEKSPGRVENVKIIEVSENYGMPPVVVTSRLDTVTRNQIKALFAHMHEDSNAKVFMDELLIDRFIFTGKDEDYNSIREMRDTLRP